MVNRSQQPHRAKASRLGSARAAIRPEMKGRMMVSAPPGGGKTYTSLLVAETIAPGGAILLIDTEKESSLTYADVFGFDQLRWNPPFDPTELAMTIREAAGTYDVVIVDSFSHFWRKQGGVLDIAAGDYRGWNQARPIQEDCVEALLDADAHVIVCCRSKMDHVMTEENGRTKVTKVGLKAQQDDDLEYEMNVALELDMSHVLTVAKSRTNAVPVGTSFLAGKAEDFATQYRDWLKAGEPAASREETDALAEALDRIGDTTERKKAKWQFLEVFGRPELLLASRLPEAQAWIADRILGIAETPNRAEGDEPADEPPPANVQPAGQKPPARTPEGQEGTQEADGAVTAEESPNGDAVLEAEVRAQVDALSNSDVLNQLRDLDESRNGTAPERRKRLVRRLLADAQAPAVE